MSNWIDLPESITDYRFFKFIQKFMNTMGRSGGSYEIKRCYLDRSVNEWLIEFNLFDYSMKYYENKKSHWVLEDSQHFSTLSSATKYILEVR